MNHNIRTIGPDEWPEIFERMRRQQSETDQPTSLLSNRARALIRAYARRDADGTNQYAGAKEAARMLELISEEMTREYETEVQRTVQIREVGG